NTIPVLPPRGGKLRLAARDESGATIASFSFDPQRIADAPDAEEHFAYAIPVNQIGMNRLASLSLSGSGLEPQTRNAIAASMTDAGVNVSSPRAGITRFKWNTAAAPLLVISDSRTGEILSLATSGDVSVRTTATSFKVKASNGVRSMEMQLRK
ncbi:MAG TPA: hypothetical protein VF042_14390, partial [Gemmatimonadaceae bacterium]